MSSFGYASLPFREGGTHISDMKSAAHLSWDELQEIGLSAASKAIDRAAAVTAPSPDVLLAEAAAAAVSLAL